MTKENSNEQLTLAVTPVPGLTQAVEDWRTARHECQVWPTREATGLYCAATDQLAQALLGDFTSEPGSQAIFDRFHNWLIETEAEPK